MIQPKLASALFAALALAACSSKKKEAPPAVAADAGAATAAATPDAPARPATPAAPARPTPAWTRGTASIALLCGLGSEATGSYPEALAKGRKAAAKKSWPEAIAAFQQALREKPNDAAVLSELSVAFLQVGDASEALMAGQLAAKQSEDPKAQAASLYNAGRAAEALGQLDLARQHYQASLALRPNESVRIRMEGTKEGTIAPQPKRVASAPAMNTCEGQASPEEVCACLVKTAASWGKSYGVTETASCEPIEKKGGARGAVLSVLKQKARPEELEPGDVLVLAAKRGDKWFALEALESAGDVDLTEQPKAMDHSVAARYEELPVAGGTLFWVESSRTAVETAMGETESEGEANLHLCVVPDEAAKAPFCSELKLGVWSLTYSPERGDDAEKCEDRMVSTYRAVLDASGAGSLIFEGGSDELRQIGRIQVPLAQ